MSVGEYVVYERASKDEEQLFLKIAIEVVDTFTYVHVLHFGFPVSLLFINFINITYVLAFTSKT